MRSFRLALAQVNPTVGDIAGNIKIVLERIEEARGFKADLVAFPELMFTGYPPEDLLMKPSFIRDNQAALTKVISAAKDITVVTGFVDGLGNDIYNAASVAHNGQVVGIYHKIRLPNYGVFDELRYFKPGNICPVYNINGVNVGINICEDIWFPQGPVPVQRDAGAKIIVNINGSPFHAGKGADREQMLANRASDNGLYIAYVNTVGGQDELVFDGASVILNGDASPIARASQFQEEMLVADLNMELEYPQRVRTPPLPAIVGAENINVSAYHQVERSPVPKRLVEPLDEVGEVYQALVLGTRDYVRKNGFSKALISLSGGIDSSLTCVIAVDALGAENVEGITMPSRYSSDGSVSDSQQMVKVLGIPIHTLPIEAVHGAMEASLDPFFTDTEPNIAEQNIQARIRGNLLMAVSNKFGWLVLTTGNKSEMATGYATIYGDMSGGFAVIKDVPKVLCYKLAEYRNTVAGHALIPRSVLDKPPSAELRPDQLDEDSLPPYEELDQILKAYVEDDLAFDEIVDLGFSSETVKQIISLVDRNEYKRRQAAPGIKITPRNFGRDRRMPIANRYRPF